MLNEGKAGRVFSLKSKESAPKNVTEETFLLGGMRPLINLFPWVKYTCCQKLQWDNRGAHTATFFSSAERTLRPIFSFTGSKNTTPELCVGFVRNLQEAKQHLRAHHPAHHKGGIWVWKLLRRWHRICISALPSDSSLQKGGNTSAHGSSW